MDVQRIREIARNVVHVDEIAVNESVQVISFINTAWDCVINVYYATGTVGTCIDHPYASRPSHMFRQNMDSQSLAEILEDPRTHSGALASFNANWSVTSLKDEETELRSQLSYLEQQIGEVCSHLAALEAERAKPLQQEATKPEVDVWACTREENARQRAISKEHRRLEEQQWPPEKRAHAARSRMINARGSTCCYSLRSHKYFPSSMGDVACVALSGRGYVALFDDGTYVFDGIDGELAAELGEYKRDRISFVAAGTEGQYYLRTRNGRSVCSGPHEMKYALESTHSPVRMVAFGDSDTYFIRFEDGHSRSSEGLEDLLGSKDFQLLTTASLDTVWLGSKRYIERSEQKVVARIGFYIGYNKKECVHSRLPTEVERWLSEKRYNSRVTQVLADERGSFFIRFSG